jgi:hypothetical protein
MKRPKIVIDPFLLRGSITLAGIEPMGCKMLLLAICESFNACGGDLKVDRDDIAIHKMGIFPHGFDLDEDGGTSRIDTGWEDLQLARIVVGGDEHGYGGTINWDELAKMGITRR